MKDINDFEILESELEMLCNRDDASSDAIRQSIEQTPLKASILMTKLVAIQQAWAHTLVIKLKAKNNQFWAPLHKESLTKLIAFARSPVDTSYIEQLTQYSANPDKIPPGFREECVNTIMGLLDPEKVSENLKQVLIEHILPTDNLAKYLQCSDGKGGKTHILNRIYFDISMNLNQKAKLYVFFSLYGPGVLVSDVRNFFEDVHSLKIPSSYPDNFFEMLVFITLAMQSVKSKKYLLNWLFFDENKFKQQCLTFFVSNVDKLTAKIKQDIAQVYWDVVSVSRKDFLASTNGEDIKHQMQTDLFMGVSAENLADALIHEFSTNRDVSTNKFEDMPQALRLPLIDKMLWTQWPQDDVYSKIKVLILLGAHANQLLFSMRHVFNAPHERRRVASADELKDLLNIFDRDWSTLSFRSSDDIDAWKTIFTHPNCPPSFFMRCYPEMSPEIKSALFSINNAKFYLKLRKDFYSDIVFHSLSTEQQSSFLGMCKEHNLLSRLANEKDVSDILIAGIQNGSFSKLAVSKQIGGSKSKITVRPYCEMVKDTKSPDSATKPVCAAETAKPILLSNLDYRLVSALKTDHKGGYKLFP